jgi:phosphoglycerol transferase MdoB-like AlkP superfamily enzyme
MLSENKVAQKLGFPWAFSAALFLRFAIFWLLLFAIQRLIFNLHFLSDFRDEEFSEYFQAYYQGFRLDLAVIGYLTLILLPFYLLWSFSINQWKQRFEVVLKSVFSLLITLSVLIHCGEVNAYEEWGHKLTTRVFTHLTNPGEVFRTATIGNYLFFFLYVGIELLAAWFFVKFVLKPIWRQSKTVRIKVIYSVVSCVVLTPLSFLFARGGWQPIPINIAAAMFSNSAIINDMSTNSTYYFLHSLNSYSKVDLDKYLSEVEAQDAGDFFNQRITNCDEYAYFLDTIRPNLVFVVLESWTADAISYSGQVLGTTPHFDTLIQEGLYFSNIYATAGTSEIGNASIFSGYPGLPQVSLTLHQDKSRKVKALNQSLKAQGYHASYLFGGDLKYGNIGGYFLDHLFDDIQDESNFKHIKQRGKLNIYDTDLLAAFVDEMNTKPTPFMSVAFTGSTHSPWDIPEEWNGFYSGEEAGIMNTIRFADFAIGQFIESAKKQPWYENTLFVFVADHGRSYPGNPFHHTPSFFRIPLLFWGPALNTNFKGVDIKKIASQTDIVATLLHQMQLDSDDYPYSRNLMCEDFEEFAIYTSSLGYGKITPSGDFFYNMLLGRYATNTFPEEEQAEALRFTRLYLKAVWERFKHL